MSLVVSNLYKKSESRYLIFCRFVFFFLQISMVGFYLILLMLLCHSFRWRLFSTDKIVIIADTKKKFLLNLSNLEMIFSFHHIWSILLVLYYMLVFDVCIYMFCLPFMIRRYIWKRYWIRLPFAEVLNFCEQTKNLVGARIHLFRNGISCSTNVISDIRTMYVWPT